MKNNLLKNLSASLPVGMAFIVTAILFSVSANAQIVYTDVNPDVVKTCTSPSTGSCSAIDSIDINNDGIFDLKLELGASRHYSPLLMANLANGFVRASPLNGSAIRTNSSGFPLKMNLNDVIDSSGSASTASGQILFSKSSGVHGSTTTSGNWSTATDGYLGLKIISGSQAYYCWVRLNVVASTTSATFTIKDYAYSSVPNQPILSGQTSTTGIIENFFASSITLFPNPAENQFTIDLGSNNKKVEVTITDITGKIIYTITTNDTNKIEVNTSEFAQGIYIVQIQSAGFIGTRKMIVEK